MSSSSALRLGAPVACLAAVLLARAAASPTISLEVAVLGPPATARALEGCFYFDTGNGYSEHETSCFRYEADPIGDFHRYRVPVHAQGEVRSIRFDPLKSAGTVAIRAVAWSGWGKRSIPLSGGPGGTPRSLYATELGTSGDALVIRMSADDPYLLLTEDARLLDSIAGGDVAEMGGEAIVLLVVLVGAARLGRRLAGFWTPARRWLSSSPVLGAIIVAAASSIVVAAIAHLGARPVVSLDLAVRGLPPTASDLYGCLYYDIGSGFSERDLACFAYNHEPVESFHRYRVVLPTRATVERIRFDPLAAPGVVALREAVIERWGSRPLDLGGGSLAAPYALEGTELEHDAGTLIAKMTGADPSFMLADRLADRLRFSAGELVRIGRDAVFAAPFAIAFCLALPALLALGRAAIHRLEARPRMARRVVETAALSWTIVSVSAKCAILSVSLPFLWVPPTDPLWRRLASRPSAMTGSVASALLLAAPLAALPPIARHLGGAALNALAASLLLADLLHVRVYGDAVSILNVPRANMLAPALGSIGALLEPYDALLFADVLVALLLTPALVRIARSRVGRGGVVPPSRMAASLFAAGLLLAAPSLRLVAEDGSGLLAPASLQPDVSAAIGLLPYHAFDVAAHFAGGGRVRDAAKRARAYLAAERAALPGRSDLFAVARGRNLVLLSAESLAAFPIHLEVRGQKVAPRLAAFAADALEFTEFHDQTGVGTTADAEFLALQSLHPLGAEAVASDFPENRFHALPEVLAERGYTTLSLVGAPGPSWNMDRLHPRLGFRENFFEDRFRMGEVVGSWLADRDFFAQSVPILTAEREPFFAFLLSSSNHHPYKMPARYHTLDLGELEGTKLGDYLQSVHYFDLAFGEFVDRLAAAGLLDRTVVAVYGDHHNILGDIPDTARLLGFPSDDAFRHLRVRKRVPFLVRLPGGRAAGQRAVFGGHLDIAPTLLALLGISEDGLPMLGRDLTSGADPLVVFRDGSFTDGEHYFVNRFGPIDASRCYRVRSGERLPCEALAEKHRRAIERLEVSDLIVRGDLIDDLSPAPTEGAALGSP